jgi:hypothetical protein
MKNINISVKRQKKELRYILYSFIIANTLNLGAIIYYKSSMMELITSLFYVMIFTILLYLVCGVIRIALYLISRSIGKNKKKNINP